MGIALWVEVAERIHQAMEALDYLIADELSDSDLSPVATLAKTKLVSQLRRTASLMSDLAVGLEGWEPKEDN